MPAPTNGQATTHASFPRCTRSAHGLGGQPCVPGRRPVGSALQGYVRHESIPVDGLVRQCSTHRGARRPNQYRKTSSFRSFLETHRVSELLCPYTVSADRVTL